MAGPTLQLLERPAALALVTLAHVVLFRMLATERPERRIPALPLAVAVTLVAPTNQPGTGSPAPSAPAPDRVRSAVPDARGSGPRSGARQPLAQPAPAQPASGQPTRRDVARPDPELVSGDSAQSVDSPPARHEVAVPLSSPGDAATGSSSPPGAIDSASPGLPATQSPAIASAPSASAVATAPPRSDADYLANPPPPYPPASRRLGEQGNVVLRVFVNAIGQVVRTEIRQSSGFDRLDLAATTAVSRWKFVPASEGGVAVAAWVLVPINFRLHGGT